MLLSWGGYLVGVIAQVRVCPVASHMPDHACHCRVRPGDSQLHVGVGLHKDPEDFVGKGLANRVHPVKPKPDHSELINPRQQAFGLRPRNELFVAVLRQSDRDSRLGEPIVVARGKPIRSIYRCL